MSRLTGTASRLGVQGSPQVDDGLAQVTRSWLRAPARVALIFLILVAAIAGAARPASATSATPDFVFAAESESGGWLSTRLAMRDERGAVRLPGGGPLSPNQMNRAILRARRPQVSCGWIARGSRANRPTSTSTMALRSTWTEPGSTEEQLSPTRRPNGWRRTTG